MTTCDACGDPIDHEPVSAVERNGEVLEFCDDCDGYKTLRVPTADWVLAQRQRDETGRTWGEQIVRTGGGEYAESASLPAIDPALRDAIRDELNGAGDFPTADVKEALRTVLKEELPEEVVGR